jgi:hypothetical protein
MPGAEDAEMFVLSLHHGPGGGPSGTLRGVDEHHEQTFEGWIGLIALITELGFAADGSHSHGDGGRDGR